MAVEITQTQLVGILKEVKGATFANVTYFVDESKSRTVKGVKQVQKQVTVNVTLNSDYANKVNKILNEKQNMEVDFEPQEMKGKKMIAPALLQSLKDAKYMLYGAIEHNSKKDTKYFYQGEEKTIAELKELNVLAPSFFEKPATKGRGSVSESNDFALISPKLDGVKRIKIKGMEFELI